MLWKKVNPKQPAQNKSKKIIDKLTPDAKAELVKYMLGNDSGITVVFGNSQVSCETVYQFNLAQH